MSISSFGTIDPLSLVIPWALYSWTVLSYESTKVNMPFLGKIISSSFKQIIANLNRYTEYAFKVNRARLSRITGPDQTSSWDQIQQRETPASKVTIPARFLFENKYSSTNSKKKLLSKTRILDFQHRKYDTAKNGFRESAISPWWVFLKNAKKNPLETF